MNNHAIKLSKKFEQQIVDFYVKKKPELIKYFKRKYTSLSSEEIEEIFQDAFFSLYKRILDEGDFKSEKERANFIFGIMENMIKTENRRTKRLIYDINKSESKSENNIEALYGETEGLTKCQIVQEFVKQLTEPCKTILEKFYLEELSYTEILIKLPSFSNTNALKAQKYKCIHRISEIIKKIFKHHDLI